MAIEYRNAAIDKLACYELLLSTGWNRAYGLSEYEYIKAVRGSWHLEGAYDREKLVGMGRIISDGQLYALIVDVIVLPEYRGQSTGTAIMQRLLSRCTSSGIRDIKLFAAKGKTDFYRRFGFVERDADAPGMGLICEG
jgi:predicted GNAT family N-acyltransferase